MSKNVKIDWNDKTLINGLVGKVAEISKSTGDQALSYAKGQIHRVSGALEATGRVATFETNKAAGAYVVFGSSSVVYPFHLETGGPVHPYGNKKVLKYRKAKPFLRNTMKKFKSQFYKKCKEAATSA